MSSNDLGDNTKPEVPKKRGKFDSSAVAIKLSSIIQKEIEKEIKLRKDDLNIIEENIFLTKKHLLRLKQGVVTDYYKEKNPKEYLQRPPHPAIKDTFLGKTPRSLRSTEINSNRDSTHFEEHKPANIEIAVKTEEITLEEEQKLDPRKTDEVKNQSIDCPKPPCYIPPKPVKVETIQPPDPRGIESKKQLRIVVGNVSKWLASTGPEATHKWTVYAKSADPDTDLADYVNKVVFFLHASYRPNDQVTVTSPPFKLTRRGWGEFPLKARFYFKNPMNSPVDVMHVLKLDSKHTGLETFGAETTLTVWIHLPPKEEINLSTEEPLKNVSPQKCTNTIPIKEEIKKQVNTNANKNRDEFQSMINNFNSDLYGIDISLDEDNIRDLIKLGEDPALSDFFASLSEGEPPVFSGTSPESNVNSQVDVISEAKHAPIKKSIREENHSLYEEALEECNVVDSEVVIDCDESYEEEEEVIEEEIVYDQVEAPDVEECLERLENELAQKNEVHSNVPSIPFLPEKNSQPKNDSPLPQLKPDITENGIFKVPLPKSIRRPSVKINSTPSPLKTAPGVVNKILPYPLSDKNALNKRKRNLIKGNVKSTVIVLQKENGQVILRKEAKYKDCRPNVIAEITKKGNDGDNSILATKNLTQKINTAQNGQLLRNSKHSLPLLDNGTSEASLKEKKSNITNNTIFKLPISTLENKKLRERALLSKCPVQNTEKAVSWLMKKYPLVDSRAVLSGFRTEHPYCAKTRDDFLNWPLPKQRAAEWMRAKTIERLLNKLPLSEKWSTLEIWDWARIRAFTPLKGNPNFEEPTESQDINYYYNQPTEEILDFIKKCKDLKEQEVVDVVSLDKISQPITDKSRNVDQGKMDFKYKLAPNKVETPFEPELEGLRKYVNRCQSNVGAMTSAEVVIPPDVLYPAAERMLISAFHSFTEDIIRRAHNASWIRHHDNSPPEISIEDVKCAIISRKEFDFLVPTKTEKKERPPVTVLPNFS